MTEKKLSAAQGAADSSVVDASFTTAEGGFTKSGMRFTKKKTVAVPVLKLTPGVPVYVHVEREMEVSKQIDNGKSKPEQATVMHCTDMESGAECTMIVGKVLEGIFNETYPEKTYVGKSFEIINEAEIGDKAHNTYAVVEIEIETE